MRRYLGIITATILGGSMIGCSSDDSGPALSAAALDDTAQLDKTYVPALYYSSVGSEDTYVQDASDTLDGTGVVWGEYKTTYADYLDWDAYFGGVDANITTASAYYAGVLADGVYPADLTTAHLELEAMRDTWSDMRTDHGIKYFFDNITASHHTMETVAGAAMTYGAIVDPVAADVLALQNDLIATLPAFSDDWDALVSKYGNGDKVNDIYDFGADKAVAVAVHISNDDPVAPGMAQMIASLSGAVENCDSTIYDPALYNPEGTDPCDTMIYVSSKIKSKFVPVFLAFGDFINPFMTDIIASNRAMIPLTYCTGNPGDSICGGLSGVQNLTWAYAGAMDTFGSHFPDSLIGGLGWGPSMMDAGMNLETAMGIILGATIIDEVTAAHVNVEAISSAMYYICATYENQVTIMTRMGEYHGAFEAVTALVKNEDGSTKTTLTAEEVAAIEAMMAGLQGAFANMGDQVTALDYTAWAQDEAVLAGLMATQEANITVLIAALAAFDVADAGTSSAIINTVLALKGTYIPFFKQLGDFTPATM